MSQSFPLPPELPKPVDDGACLHLPGTRIPSIALPSTSGRKVNLATLASPQIVLYCYPMTGVPGKPLPKDWDNIPGARGCTPQTCEFRDHHGELKSLGAEVFGLSTQKTEYQQEMVERLHVPFEVLSDSEFQFSDVLHLPTFEAEGMRLIKRLTLVIKNGVIAKVFYPVFPPNENAQQVIEWLKVNP